MTPRINFPVSPARFCRSIEYSRCLLQTRWFSKGSHHLEDGLPGIVRIVRIAPFVFWAMKNCEVRPFGREQPQPQLYRGQQRSPWLIRKPRTQWDGSSNDWNRNLLRLEWDLNNIVCKHAFPVDIHPQLRGRFGIWTPRKYTKNTRPPDVWLDV